MPNPESVPSLTQSPFSVTQSPFESPKTAHLREEIAHVRHSLGTPLNQIIGYSEMLIESADEMNISNLVKDLKCIHNAGGEIHSIVTDALATWKIAVGQIDLVLLEQEIRTPLNTVIGYAELCHDEAVAAGLAQVANDLQSILKAASNLSNIYETQVRPLAPQYAAAPSTGTRSPIPLKAEDPATAQEVTGGDNLPTIIGRILVVDDDGMNRYMLRRRLVKLGHDIAEAVDGQDALQKLMQGEFDLVLLDVMMPVMDGFQTLEMMKSNPRTRNIPAIMLTALDDPSRIARCIEAGAEDYVSKPFNPVVLRARISASLEKKRLLDQERAHLAEIQSERAKSDRLLLNVMPRAIADRLKAGENTIVESFAECTVLFVDIVGFSRIASGHTPQRTAQLLNEIFSNFDHITDNLKLEKIKTIGDAYMLVGGVPIVRKDHAHACAEAAFGMLESMRAFNRRNQVNWSVRIGMNSGPVVAGIIGTRKFSYDLWGQTVNIASRMESHGIPGRIQIPDSTKDLLGGLYEYEPQGLIAIKNAGEIFTYLLRRK
ncbi:MAG: response regulator [Cephaloticoccus sp.]|nr:response regulator [Cephaloticoccus sp.]